MFKNKFYTYSILSGIFIGTSFIPFPPWACLFAFIPLWKYWLQEPSAKKIFWSGWITQFILTLVGFNWIILTIHDFGNLPWALSALGLFTYCSVTNLFIPIAGLCFSFLRTKLNLNQTTSLLVMATTTAILQPLVPTIFSWNFGYSLMTLPLPIYHSAEWLGFEGLSSIIIYLNVLSFGVVFSFPAKKLSRPLFAGLIITVVSGLWIVGHQLKKNVAKPDRSIKVGIIQANIGNLEEQFEIHGFGFRSKIINKYLDISYAEQKKSQPDVLIWPETAAAIKMGPKINSLLSSSLMKSLSNYKIKLIAGAYSHSQTGQTSNSVMFIDQGEYTLPYYSKTHLLAFGEYIPGSQFFPGLKKILPQVSDFKAGNGPQITRFLDINFGVQICYESLFPKFTTQLSQLGTEIILNVTNDSWYGEYAEPFQHLYMTLARAIEVRRPLIRSTNTGISTVILADGTIMEKSPTNKEWSHTFNVAYKSDPKPTFYSLYPDLIFYIKLILLASLTYIGWKRRPS